jgi:glycerate 2-kinase
VLDELSRSGWARLGKDEHVSNLLEALEGVTEQGTGDKDLRPSFGSHLQPPYLALFRWRPGPANDIEGLGLRISEALGELPLHDDEGDEMARVLVAPDKFRSTASAKAVAAACGRAVAAAGHVAELLPLADGGEGLLEVVGGSLQTTIVHGPLGEEVAAAWRLLAEAPGAEPATAVIEMAAASGLELVGGAAGNDPMAASTKGTGELIEAALDHGATRIIVGLGGSATTDGGVGALEVIADDERLKSTELLVACDVTTTFVFAAEVFGPQKGATPAMVGLLGRRLDAVAEHYLDRFGVDVRQIPGSGAAGGLGGGLAALGARLRSGFELVADLLGLDRAIEGADLVITGEGRLDVTSFTGKVVGSLRDRVAGRTAIACVVGEATPEAMALAGDMTVMSLSDRYGGEKARSDTEALIEATCAEFLAAWSPGP